VKLGRSTSSSGKTLKMYSDEVQTKQEIVSTNQKQQKKMEKVANNECKLVSIQKAHCVFEVGVNKEIAFASPRVANDILHGAPVFLERNIEVKEHNIGNWLATPSRFN
jgi:hypothetical protein